MNSASNEILAIRGSKNEVDPFQPYAFIHEREPVENGLIETFATIFLTNRECPFRCTMCDLWKNTTNDRVPAGAIPQQIRVALENLPTADNIKLYNSGNFFDPQAIPPEDLEGIAELVAPFKTLVVENHPKLTGKSCIEFARSIKPNLEVAMGLETIHPRILPTLNKQMTIDDFSRAVELLISNDISVRAFILLKPPGLEELEAIDWAIRSVEYAFSLGVSCCSMIPVRSGNGWIDQLIADGKFAQPKLRSLEIAYDRAIALKQGRVFVDTWDLERFSDCSSCLAGRRTRLEKMNLNQTVVPPVQCAKCDAP